MKHLMNFKFPLMGNLNPSGRPEFERVTWLEDLSLNKRFVSLSDDAELAIDPVASIPFFYMEIVSVYRTAAACSKPPRVT
jgi:hypothetical protein